MAVVKAKIFTFNAGWGYIASKPDSKLFTLTFLYKD